jgi:AraC-like DNA-binding protein
MLIGLVMSFSLANQNYQKLRGLVRILRERKGDGQAMNGTVDEIAYLSGVLRETVEQEGVMAKLNSRNGLLREKLLLSLLQGKGDKLEDLDNLIEVSGIRFEHARYAVMLLEIDNYRQFQQQHPASMQDLFKFSIINVAEELAGEIGKGYGIDLAEGRGIAVVINMPELDQEKLTIREMAVKIQMFFKTYYKFSLSIGVGQSCGQLGGLSASFAEAERAVYYRFVRGNEQVLFYGELQETGSEGWYAYPIELEVQLIKSIRQGKPDEAERTVRSLLGYITALSVTPESAQAACGGLVHMLARTIDELDSAAQPHWRVTLEVLQTGSYETIAYLEEELVKLCRDVCESMSIKKESRNFELRDNIIAYIEICYADNNLTLERIASHFGMSPSYITRFIKDQTGLSLIRYLDQLRLEKTKELLRTTSVSVSEIAESVGYVDISNFIRKFKKAEGITPAQYRMLFNTEKL